ncbi:RNA polymerase sigma factor [Neolewinella aurantiaca]|uniref:RNA polymerase sigma factor n=1 Tax=Neolewinella aurantiaca TaxID=2602767 RepID=A0A5C7FS93_9BACT|nr:RNA polymerase sigma factor [Neolewinella aurantiaca]TXF90908.1 RNA polymerase sigma factor [Neolewinella aurantiaca]
MDTDEDIMAAVVNGQLERLAELYRRYRRPLYGFLLKRVNAPAAAEDLLQTTFERVIKYRASFREGSSFRSWVFTIARNAVHDSVRKEQRMPVKSDVDLGVLPILTPSAHCDWEKRETRSQSAAALAALPESYREVVDLAWKRGLKYAEIAEVLGLSEANVKVRIHRAVKQLRINYAKIEQQ